MSDEQLELGFVDGEAGDPVALLAELCQVIDRFNAYWPQFVVEAVVFRIPFYDDGRVPEMIEPERIKGQAAITLCVSSFRAFSRLPELQHPGSVHRMPGYIVLDRFLVDEIDEINQLKQHLQDAIKQRYPNDRARNAYCRQVLPGRVMLQIYRQIYTVRSSVRTVRFTWSPKTSATRHLTKAETLDLLLQRLELGIDIDEHQYALNSAIEKTKALRKSANIIIERPRAPYPMATIVHEPGRNGIKKMVPLSLPIFIGQGVGGEKVDIGQLAVHDTDARRKERSDRKHSVSLFKPLYLRYRL